MSERKTPPDPSMEEILASIRRIISDDSARPVPSPAPVVVSAREEPVIAMPLAPRPEDTIEPARVQAIPLEVEPRGEPRRSGRPRRAVEVEDVLELTQVYQPRILPEADGRHGRSEPEFSPDSAIRPDPAAPPEAPHRDQRAEAAGLVSPDVAAEAAAAIAAITRAGFASAGPDLGGLATGSGRTLDDLVRELLRPMLKEWLDSRLPGLVEAVVREEIERVVRRSNPR
ncbi:pole-organizing protein PopZ [Allostella vacuolata]|nr:pole-organizing protein PopZ [Stella vacuolata]